MKRRPIRIGNASGAIGDGIDQVYRLASSGEVDAITADYLAEFNIAWKAIELQNSSGQGYESGFLDQLNWKDGDAAREIYKCGIKVVHNGGALDPEGLANRVQSYFKELGMENIKVAWISGDDLTKNVQSGKLTTIRSLESPSDAVDLSSEQVLAVNAYTGQQGIVRALEEGADIVICGRCCDASPVMGLATWWHGWDQSQFDELAGALMAGHLIECGAYVTGGNFCGAQEITNMLSVGSPIAEISHDGTSVITKPKGTNGAVTVDTCKAQLLYEIQGTKYLNADVVAAFTNAKLTELAPNRVELTGITGIPRPGDLKVAICLFGGHQAELSGFCVGLDIDFKFTLMKEQIMQQLDLSRYLKVSIEKYGSAATNPASQAESTVMIRMFVQSSYEEAIYDFRRAIFYNGMQGYCGLHLAMDWRTLQPRTFVKYIPGLVPQSSVTTQVHFVGSAQAYNTSPLSTTFSTSDSLIQHHHEADAHRDSSDDDVWAPLGDLIFARSGDKGGNANVGFWVREESAWPWLRDFMTSSRLKNLLGNDWRDIYSIQRCQFENLWAVHFVIKRFLQDGVSSSSILDGFAKSLGEYLRARHTNLPRQLVEAEQKRRSKQARQTTTRKYKI